MSEDQKVNQTDVRTLKLLERKGVVQVRFLVRNRLKLPPHQVGGNTLIFVQAGPVEFIQFGQAALRPLNAIQFPR